MSHAAKLRKDMLRRSTTEKHGNRCYLCGAPATTVEHVVPNSRAPGLDYTLPACGRCNNAKGSLSLKEYLDVSGEKTHLGALH